MTRKSSGAIGAVQGWAQTRARIDPAESSSHCCSFWAKRGQSDGDQVCVHECRTPRFVWQEFSRERRLAGAVWARQDQDALKRSPHVAWRHRVSMLSTLKG